MALPVREVLDTAFRHLGLPVQKRDIQKKKTARDLVYTALATLGNKPDGVPVSSDDASLVLQEINIMLSSLTSEGIIFEATSLELGDVFPLGDDMAGIFIKWLVHELLPKFGVKAFASDYSRAQQECILRLRVKNNEDHHTQILHDVLQVLSHDCDEPFPIKEDAGSRMLSIDNSLKGYLSCLVALKLADSLHIPISRELQRSANVGRQMIMAKYAKTKAPPIDPLYDPRHIL